jgi:hypothetical protein
MKSPDRPQKEAIEAPNNSLDDTGIEINLMTWDLLEYYPSLETPENLIKFDNIKGDSDSAAQS